MLFDPNLLSSNLAKYLHKLKGLRKIMLSIKKGPAGDTFLSKCISTFKHSKVLYPTGFELPGAPKLGQKEAPEVSPPAR